MCPHVHRKPHAHRMSDKRHVANSEEDKLVY